MQRKTNTCRTFDPDKALLVAEADCCSQGRDSSWWSEACVNTFQHFTFFTPPANVDNIAKHAPGSVDADCPHVVTVR